MCMAARGGLIYIGSTYLSYEFLQRELLQERNLLQNAYRVCKA